MQNGTYRVEFITKNGTGTGVVIIHDGQVRGGDSSMVYVGTMSQEGKTVTAQVKAEVHSQVAGMASVFGVNTVNITLTGQAGNVEDSLLLEGSAKEAPGVEFKAYMKRLCD